MATQTTLTLQEFLALPQQEPDGTHYELSEGDLVTLSPSAYPHGVIVMNVGGILRAKLDRKNLIIAGGEVGLVLNTGPTSATIRGSDVVVHTRGSNGAIPTAGYLAVPPLLAVEVVSPANNAADLELKVRQYLDAGTGEIWLLYPASRRLHVYLHGAREAKIFEEHESFKSIVGCEFEVALFFEL